LELVLLGVTLVAAVALAATAVSEHDKCGSFGLINELRRRHHDEDTMMKRLSMFALVVAAGILAPPARASMVCWLDHLTAQTDSAKLVFADPPYLVEVTHRDGTRTQIKALSSGPMTVDLHIGEDILVTQGLHSSCQIKVTRVRRRLQLAVTVEVGMPGMPLDKSIKLLAAGADGRFHEVRADPADTSQLQHR
jgi:hypothetical protein